jgi:hypothetical protein
MNSLTAVAIVIMDKADPALLIIRQRKPQVVKLVMLKIMMGSMTQLMLAVTQVWMTYQRLLLRHG